MQSRHDELQINNYPETLQLNEPGWSYPNSDKSTSVAGHTMGFLHPTKSPHDKEDIDTHFTRVSRLNSSKQNDELIMRVGRDRPFGSTKKCSIRAPIQTDDK